MRVAVVGELIQRRDQPHPNLYLGPGKVDELKGLIKAADANLVACDDELTPRQERNLEKELGVPVLDRTALQRRDAFPVDVPAGKNQPVWVEVCVPPGAAPGVFAEDLDEQVGAPVDHRCDTRRAA